MIALLQGEVAARRSDHVVILCGGVGYRLAVSAQTLAAVGPVGSSALLHAHLVVRDDALSLYGFATESERDLFLALLGVQSVGPKLALAVLGAGPVRSLHRAIGAGDAGFFSGVSGVGKRTAERIIVELREKVGEAADGGSPASEDDLQEPVRLARDGLLELGFSSAEADALLARSEGTSSEELLAGALRAARAGART